MKKTLKKFLTPGRSIGLYGAIILVLSIILPWGYTDYALKTQWHGEMLIFIGILSFTFLFVKKVHICLALLFQTGALILGIYDFYTIETNYLVISSGSGLYMILFGSFIMLMGIIIVMRERRKKFKVFYLEDFFDMKR